jgi:hypothetical protein
MASGSAAALEAAGMPLLAQLPLRLVEMPSRLRTRIEAQPLNVELEVVVAASVLQVAADNEDLRLRHSMKRSGPPPPVNHNQKTTARRIACRRECRES